MTQCESSGMKSINVETLMGHSKPTELHVLEDYMTHAIDFLTISDEPRLKKQVEKLESEREQEIDRLKVQLQEKEQQLHALESFLSVKKKKCRHVRILFAIMNMNEQISTFLETTGYELLFSRIALWISIRCLSPQDVS